MSEFVEFLTSPLASAVFLLALIAMLIVVGAYVIGKVRSGYRENEPQASKWMTNFQELHEQGELNDEEYRSIKARLSAQLQRELSDSDQP